MKWTDELPPHVVRVMQESKDLIVLTRRAFVFTLIREAERMALQDGCNMTPRHVFKALRNMQQKNWAEKLARMEDRGNI